MFVKLSSSSQETPTPLLDLLWRDLRGRRNPFRSSFLDSFRYPHGNISRPRRSGAFLNYLMSFFFRTMSTLRVRCFCPTHYLQVKKQKNLGVSHRSLIRTVITLTGVLTLFKNPIMESGSVVLLRRTIPRYDPWWSDA